MERCRFLAQSKEGTSSSSAHTQVPSFAGSGQFPNLGLIQYRGGEWRRELHVLAEQLERSILPTPTLACIHRVKVSRTVHI